MYLRDCRTDLPVILIYDVDFSWPLHDIKTKKDSARQLSKALADVEHPVEELCIQSTD